MMWGPGFLKGFGVPSFFDCLVALWVIGLVIVPQGMFQGLYLVYGSLTIWVISLGLKQRRHFGSLPLVLLTLWVMVNGALKSWRKDPTFPEFINWSMMNEGMIYVIASAILIATIVRYSKTTWLYYVVIMSVIVGWFATYVVPNVRCSPIMACVVAVPIILIKARHRLLGALSAIIGLSVYMKMFLKWFDRIPVEFNKDKDFDTYVSKWSVYTRYSYGFSDWKWIYGHNVS